MIATQYPSQLPKTHSTTKPPPTNLLKKSSNTFVCIYSARWVGHLTLVVLRASVSMCNEQQQQRPQVLQLWFMFVYCPFNTIIIVVTVNTSSSPPEQLPCMRRRRRQTATLSTGTWVLLAVSDKRRAINLMSNLCRRDDNNYPAHRVTRKDCWTICNLLLVDRVKKRLFW